MKQSIKELLVELDWCENSSIVPSIASLMSEGSQMITQHTFLYISTHLDQISMNVSPTHLSTHTPYRTLILNSETIRLYGDNNSTILPISMSEESYFQASLIHDLSDLPIEFIQRCEEVFLKVMKKVYEPQ